MPDEGVNGPRGDVMRDALTAYIEKDMRRALARWGPTPPQPGDRFVIPQSKIRELMGYDPVTPLQEPPLHDPALLEAWLDS